MEPPLQSAGKLGFVQACAAFVEAMQDGNDEEYKSQATNPLRHTAPHQQPLRFRLDRFQHRRACGGEPRKGFESGIGEVGHRAGEEVGQRAHKRYDEPNDGCEPETFLLVQFERGSDTKEIAQEKADDKDQQPRRNKSELRPVAVIERHADRQHHRDGHNHQQHTHQPEGQAEVEGRPTHGASLYVCTLA